MKAYTSQRAMVYCTLQVIVAALMISSASATNYIWNNTGTGSYVTGTNWTPAGPPMGGLAGSDRSYIQNGGTATLGTSEAGLGGFVIINATSSLTVSGGTLTSETLEIGTKAGETGTVNISAGAVNVTSGQGYVHVGGNVTSSTGILNISGGTFTTGGVGASLDVGEYGNGQFNVTGGTTSIGKIFRVGFYTGSVGTVSISNGSVTAGTELTIGRAGTATVGVTGSGILKSGSTGNNSIALASLTGSIGTLNIGTGGTAGTVQATDITGGVGTATVNFNHTGTLSFAPLLKGTLSVIKSASGTTTISGINTYTGTTTINAGTMLVAASATATNSAFTVKTGGTLGGGGTVGSVTVDAGGTLAPGNSPGILGTGNLSLAGTLAAEINGTAVGTQYDQVNVTGTVDLVSGNTITLSLGITPTNGDNFFLIKNDGADAITGLLNGYAQGSSFSLSGQSWKISYVGDFGSNSFAGGNDLVIQAIPEPSTFALLAISLITVITLCRRRRQTA